MRQCPGGVSFHKCAFSSPWLVMFKARTKPVRFDFLGNGGENVYNQKRGNPVRGFVELQIMFSLAPGWVELSQQ